MVDRREFVHSLINAVRSAGLPLAAWTIEQGELHLLMAGGIDVVLPVTAPGRAAASSVVADLIRQMPPLPMPVTVRSPEEIIELSPMQAARLRFMRWLVVTGRLTGDTSVTVPTSATLLDLA